MGNLAKVEDKAAQKKGNVLVVDDTAQNLDLLSEILAGDGFEVRPVKSGGLALVSAQTVTPDLILLDIMMPGMDGYEVCRRLKQDDRTRDVPVIFISALEEPVDRLRAFEVGGVDFITKPFQAEEALALFASEQPDLVLMDMRMPVMDGYEATRRLKATQRGKDTPLIAVSASALAEADLLSA